MILEQTLENQEPIKYSTPDVLNVDLQFKEDMEQCDLKTLVDKIGAINGEFELFVRRPNGEIVVLYSARCGYDENQSGHLDVDVDALRAFGMSARNAIDMKWTIGHELREDQIAKGTLEATGEGDFISGPLHFPLSPKFILDNGRLPEQNRIAVNEEKGVAVYAKCHFGFKEFVMPKVKEKIPIETSPGVRSSNEFREVEMDVKDYLEKILPELTSPIAKRFQDILRKRGSKPILSQEVRKDESGKDYVSTSIKDAMRAKSSVEVVHDVQREIGPEFFHSANEAGDLRKNLEDLLFSGALTRTFGDNKPRSVEVEWLSSNVYLDPETALNIFGKYTLDDVAVGKIDLKNGLLSVDGESLPFTIEEVKILPNGVVKLINPRDRLDVLNTERRFVVTQSNGTRVILDGYVERLFPIRVGYSNKDRDKLEDIRGPINQGILNLICKAQQVRLKANKFVANWLEAEPQIMSIDEYQRRKTGVYTREGIDRRALTRLNESGFLTLLARVPNSSIEEMLAVEKFHTKYGGFLSDDKYTYPFKVHMVWSAKDGVKFGDNRFDPNLRIKRVNKNLNLEYEVADVTSTLASRAFRSMQTYLNFMEEAVLNLH